MHSTGLSFGPQFTGVCVLDADGQVLDEGLLRTSEAGFRQRFSSAPPCLLAAGWSETAARWTPLLVELGHTVLLGGPLEERLRPALAPLVAAACAPGLRRTLTVRDPQHRGGLGFVLEIAENGAIEEAWYFAGPAPSQPLPVPAVAASAPAQPAYEYARRLRQFAGSGSRRPACGKRGSAAA